MKKNKGNKSKTPAFVVVTVSNNGMFGDTYAKDLAHAESIAKAQRLLYKGKYGIYELVQVVD